MLDVEYGYQIKIVIRDIIKQLVEVTNNEVIFTGSLSEVLWLNKGDARDIDIILQDYSLLNSLAVFGEIKEFRKNPMFHESGRAHIWREKYPIDIFIRKEENWDYTKYDGILVKVKTIESQIQYLSDIETDNNFYKEKFKNRIEKLKRIKWQV